MSKNLDDMSRKELLQLKGDIESALKAAEVRERKEALKAAEKAAAEFGFSLGELAGNGKGAGAKSGKAAPKYRNPFNHEETWTGRGRKPKWVHEALAQGADITELEI
jgi:DNA-binding protein H-NS